jgi:LCP family protein required for cell wall assembly
MPNGDPPKSRRLADAFDYGTQPPVGPPPDPARATGGVGDGGGRAHRTRRRILTGLSVLAVVVVVAVVGTMVVVNNKFDLINRLGADTRLDAAEGPARNYLVIGSDNRDRLDPDDPASAVFLGGAEVSPGGQRADVIMIMRVDPEANTVDVLSIPRDLWVPISGTDEEERINSAYAGGPQQMIDTIREDFGIDINHYVEVDFVGFQGLVDAVGGVPMWFDQPMRDANSGLEIGEAGCVNLDGYQALAFVRARYLEQYTDQGWVSDPTGDVGRISRQQVFIRRVMDKVASDVSLTNLGGLNSVADVAVDNVTIDATMDLRSVLGLTRRFSSLNDESLTFMSLPTTRWFTPGGADVQLMDAAAAEPMLAVFRGGETREVAPRLVPITVLNGTSIEGQAGRAATALEGVGFTVIETGNAGDAYTTNTVRFGPGGEATASLMARHLSGGADLEADEGLPDGAVILVTGADFTTVLTEPLALDDPSLVGRPGFEVVVIDPDAVPQDLPGVVPGDPPEGVTCP